jgi:hypothetical protein
MIIDEQGSGDTAVAHVRHASVDEGAEFWAVQQKEDGRWYTVDDFQSLEEAEEFLQQLIDGEGDE